MRPLLSACVVFAGGFLGSPNRVRGDVNRFPLVGWLANGGAS